MTEEQELFDDKDDEQEDDEELTVSVGFDFCEKTFIRKHGD